MCDKVGKSINADERGKCEKLFVKFQRISWYVHVIDWRSELELSDGLLDGQANERIERIEKKDENEECQS